MRQKFPPGSARSWHPLINWHTCESEARSAGYDAGPWRPLQGFVGDRGEHCGQTANRCGRKIRYAEADGRELRDGSNVSAAEPPRVHTLG